MFNLEKALIPKPQHIKNFNKEIKIAEFKAPKFTIDVKCDGDIVSSGLDFFKEKLYDLALLESFDNKESEYKIIVKIDAKEIKLANIDNKEAYYIAVDDNEAVVCGADEAGVLYGLITLADLLHKEGSEIFLAKCEIVD